MPVAAIVASDRLAAAGLAGCSGGGAALHQLASLVAGARAAARRRLDRAEAERLLATYGGELDVTPIEGVMALIRLTAGHVEWLRRQVEQLSPEEMVWGPTERRHSKGGKTEVISRATPHVWVTLYQEERRHLAEVCSLAVRAGLEEKRLKLQQAQSETIADVIRQVLDDEKIGLSGKQRDLGRKLAASHLRALSVVPEGA